MKYTDEEIVKALIEQGTIRSASEVLCCQERTIYERMKKESFKALYNQAKSDIVKTATTMLQGHLVTAINTLVEIMTDKETASQTRVNCAESIIRNTLKLTEASDILERLEELEMISKDYN